MTFAFLAPLIGKSRVESAVGGVLPSKPEPEILERIKRAEEEALVRSFNPNKLDARPVIWSLYHHPEEWCFHPGTDGQWLNHGDSRHSVCIIPGSYQVAAPGCSCNRVEFQSSQLGEFEKAVAWWKGERSAPPDYPKPTVKGGRDAYQFAEHFIH